MNDSYLSKSRRGMMTPIVLMAAVAAILTAMSSRCDAQSSRTIPNQPGQRAAPQSDWWNRAAQSRTKYYNVKTDLPTDEAVAIAEHMDRTFESYAALFSGLKLRKIARLDVLIFNSREDYTDVLRERFNDNAANSGGKCITRGNVITLAAWKGRLSTRQLQGTLQHEGFHQFAQNFFPRLPTWANEGLAEVFQRGVLVGDKIVLGEVSYSDVVSLRNSKKEDRFKSIGDILTIKQRDWNRQLASGNAGANYLQAWCIVHCFLYADDSKYQSAFMNFLVGINQGAKWEDAFVAAFGVPNFESMNEVWLKYVNTLTPMDYRETIRRMQFLASGYEELLTQGEFPMTFAELESGLKEIGYEFETDLFEDKIKFGPENPNSFRIPYEKFWLDKPFFELVDKRGKPPKTRKSSSKSTSSKGKNTRPPWVIRTSGMPPQTFTVRWKRSRKRDSGYLPIFSAE